MHFVDAKGILTGSGGYYGIGGKRYGIDERVSGFCFRAAVGD